MKTTFALFFAVIIAFAGHGQSAKKCLHKGLKKLESHNYYGAIFDFTRAMEKNPQFAEAYYYRGIAKRGMNKTMVVSPNGPVKVIQFNPGKTGADTTKRPVACKLIDFKGTVDSLNEVLLINPKDTSAYFKRGSARMGLKDYQGAVDDFTMALVIDPGYPDAFYSRGMANYFLKSYDEAVADFSKAIEIDSGNAKAYIQRSFTKGALNDNMGSKADLAKAMEIDPRWELVTVCPGGPGNTGEFYYGEIDDYTRAIEINPKYANAYYQRGLARIKSGQKDSGCLDLSKARELGVKEAYEIIREKCN